MPFARMIADMIWPFLSSRVREAAVDAASHAVREAEIDWRDPLAVFGAKRDHAYEMLRQAANEVGTDVIVGRCTLWGGRTDKAAGLCLGDRVRLYDGCRLVIDHLSGASGITLGEGVAMNFNCYVEGSGGVVIGKGTIFGPNVVVVSSSHGISPDERGAKSLGRVVIGERVWVGASAVILAGVTIGEGAVIAAGSVVRESVPPGVLAAGAPARVVRELREQAP